MVYVLSDNSKGIDSIKGIFDTKELAEAKMKYLIENYGYNEDELIVRGWFVDKRRG